MCHTSFVHVIKNYRVQTYTTKLLKINSEQHFRYFFDTMLTHSFCPKITFPTRVNKNSGATLIDNIFCKLSSASLQNKARILLDEISDHYPYFVSLNVSPNPNKPPRLVKKRVNSDKAIQGKFEKFNKHKHKNNKWISVGIVRSIKTRDAMYLKFKRCKQHNFDNHTFKNNLHIFNCILKKTIRKAKIQYYDKLFFKYKNDIKKTWQTISNIICKSNTKRKTLDKIIVDSKVIKDKEDICN